VEADAGVVEVSHDQGRLEMLYRQQVPRNLRLAFLLIGDRELARDFAHDAFIRSASRLHTLRNPEVFGAYMTRTLVNLTKRHHERRALERRELARQAAQPDHPSVLPDIAARDELLSALRRLPHRQRAVLVLRFYEDLSEAQIADLLGCPAGTVKSLMSRGLEALRRVVGGTDD
jgi:RNA polymerase sigma-70 factor (sigma-E family)